MMPEQVVSLHDVDSFHADADSIRAADFKGFAYVDILTHQAPPSTQGSEEAPAAEGKKAASNDPVQKVIHAFNNLLWQGRRLRVERAQPDHLARHQQSHDALATPTAPAAAVDPVVVKRAARVAARKAKKAPTRYSQVPPEDQPCALRPGADGAVELKVRRAKGARVIKVRCDPVESSVGGEAAEAARLEALPPAKRAKQRANLRPRGARIRMEGGGEADVPAVDELDWCESEVGDWEAEAEERRRVVAQGKGELQGEEEGEGSPSTPVSDDEDSKPVFVPRRLLPPKFRVQPLPSHLCNMRHMGIGGAGEGEGQGAEVVQAESSHRSSASDSSPSPHDPSPAPTALGLAQPINVCGEEQGGTVKGGVSQPLPLPLGVTTHKRREPPAPEAPEAISVTHKRREPPAPEAPEADSGQQVERKRGKRAPLPVPEPEHVPVPVPPPAVAVEEDVHAAVSAERAAHLAYLEHLFGGRSTSSGGEQAGQGRQREVEVEVDGQELARVQEEARERAKAVLSSTESTVEFNARPTKGQQRQGQATRAGAGKKRQREPVQQQAAGQGEEQAKAAGAGLAEAGSLGSGASSSVRAPAPPKGAWRDLVYGESLAQAGRTQLSLHSALTKAHQGGKGEEGAGTGAQTWAGFKLVKDMVEEAEVKASLPAYARPIKEGVAGTAFLAPVRGPWKTWSSAAFKASSLFGDSVGGEGEQQPPSASTGSAGSAGSAGSGRPVSAQGAPSSGAPLETAGGGRGIDNRPAWMKALDTGATTSSAAPRGVPGGAADKPAAGQWGAKPSAAPPQHRKPAAPAQPHSQPRPAPAVSASALLAAASSFTASFAFSSGLGLGGAQQCSSMANSYKQLAKQAHMAAQRKGHKGR